MNRAVLYALLVSGVPLALTGQRARAAAEPAVVGGARGEWKRFAGDWRPVAGSAQLVEQAIDEATEPLSRMARNIARARLQRRCAPPDLLRMKSEGDAWLIEFVGAPPQVLPRSGAPKVEPDGRTLSVRMEYGMLRHSGTAPDGTRENVFRVEDDSGALIMDTTVTSPRLPGPVRFTVRFTRVSLAGSRTGTSP